MSLQGVGGWVETKGGLRYYLANSKKYFGFHPIRPIPAHAMDKMGRTGRDICGCLYTPILLKKI